MYILYNIKIYKFTFYNVFFIDSYIAFLINYFEHHM